jgi:hypothetical protein
MAPDSFAERRVGTTLRDKWTLERILGVGGMAAVYVGVHELGRREGDRHRPGPVHEDAVPGVVVERRQGVAEDHDAAILSHEGPRIAGAITIRSTSNARLIRLEVCVSIVRGAAFTVPKKVPYPKKSKEQFDDFSRLAVIQPLIVCVAACGGGPTEPEHAGEFADTIRKWKRPARPTHNWLKILGWLGLLLSAAAQERLSTKED